MVLILRSLVLVFFGWFSYFFFGDYVKARKENKLEKETSYVKAGIIGTIANFCDALGIGSFAIITTLMRFFKQIDDRIIPGTLNVSCTIPTMLQAIIFVSIIKVDSLTLFAMIIGAVIGGTVGAKVVSKWEKKVVQRVMGIALLATALIMLGEKFHLISSLGTGTAIGLRGIKLVVATIVNCVLGALMTAGVGLYAPCMALVYSMGLDPKVAYPIMMASSAFVMPSSSLEFIKAGAYNRKASLVIALGGSLGVIVAAYIVGSIQSDMLIWIVILVVVYTGIMLLKESYTPKEVKEDTNSDK